MSSNTIMNDPFSDLSSFSVQDLKMPYSYVNCLNNLGYVFSKYKHIFVIIILSILVLLTYFYNKSVKIFKKKTMRGGG